MKPHASSRGRGIFILRDLADLPMEETSVVSEYLENPLLIQGLKFDLRVYVLVTSYDPLCAYIYREGLVRFATMPYSTEDRHLSDAYRHLTNYSINKLAPIFMENKQVKADNVGHKWSLSALNRHLKCVDVDVDLMWVRIMDLIVKSLLSVQQVISAKQMKVAAHPTNCFELYGFDVMVDDNLKPWLIEVNLSPSMQAPERPKLIPLYPFSDCSGGVYASFRKDPKVPMFRKDAIPRDREPKQGSNRVARIFGRRTRPWTGRSRPPC